MTTKKLANACNPNHRAFVPPTFSSFEKNAKSKIPKMKSDSRKTARDPKLSDTLGFRVVHMCSRSKCFSNSSVVIPWVEKRLIIGVLQIAPFLRREGKSLMMASVSPTITLVMPALTGGCTEVKIIHHHIIHYYIISALSLLRCRERKKIVVSAPSTG